MQREPLERARDCEACGSKFTEHDMLAFFPREEVDKVVLQATLAFLDAEPSCVKCPKEGCGARIMLNAEASAKNISRIAPDGQSLTKAAAKHMAENRIRCPDCSTNFCSSCMAAPYHVTFTCQEYKERQVCTQGQTAPSFFASTSNCYASSLRHPKITVCFPPLSQRDTMHCWSHQDCISATSVEIPLNS